MPSPTCSTFSKISTLREPHAFPAIATNPQSTANSSTTGRLGEGREPPPNQPLPRRQPHALPFCFPMTRAGGLPWDPTHYIRRIRPGQRTAAPGEYVRLRTTTARRDQHHAARRAAAPRERLSLRRASVCSIGPRGLRTQRSCAPPFATKHVLCPARVLIGLGCPSACFAAHLG